MVMSVSVIVMSAAGVPLLMVGMLRVIAVSVTVLAAGVRLLRVPRGILMSVGMRFMITLVVGGMRSGVAGVRFVIHDAILSGLGAVGLIRCRDFLSGFRIAMQPLLHFVERAPSTSTEVAELGRRHPGNLLEVGREVGRAAKAGLVSDLGNGLIPVG